MSSRKHRFNNVVNRRISSDNIFTVWPTAVLVFNSYSSNIRVLKKRRIRSKVILTENVQVVMGKNFFAIKFIRVCQHIPIPTKVIIKYSLFRMYNFRFFTTNIISFTINDRIFFLYLFYYYYFFLIT